MFIVLIDFIPFINIQTCQWSNLLITNFDIYVYVNPWFLERLTYFYNFLYLLWYNIYLNIWVVIVPFVGIAFLCWQETRRKKIPRKTFFNDLYCTIDSAKNFEVRISKKIRFWFSQIMDSWIPWTVLIQ